MDDSKITTEEASKLLVQAFDFDAKRIDKPKMIIKKREIETPDEAIAEQYLRGKAISKELNNENRKRYMASIKMCHITFDKEYFKEFKTLCGLVPVNTMIKQLMKNYMKEMTTR